MVISSSASRLEHTPLFAIYLFNLIFSVCAGASSSLGPKSFRTLEDLRLLEDPFESSVNLRRLGFLKDLSDEDSPESLFPNDFSSFGSSNDLDLREV
jgi:hypothetical protein